MIGVTGAIGIVRVNVSPEVVLAVEGVVDMLLSDGASCNGRTIVTTFNGITDYHPEVWQMMQKKPQTFEFPQVSTNF